jgi:membrane protein DedA with SNARE-associated domain
VTIASGLAAFSFPIFIIASVITRGARFFLVAGLIKHFGPQMQQVIERRMMLITSLVLIVLVGGFVAVKLLG